MDILSCNVSISDHYYYVKKVLLASDICTEASQCEMGGNAKLIILTSLLWILSGVSTARMKRRPLEDPGVELAPYPAQSYHAEDRSTAFTESDVDDEIVVLNSNSMT